jgi:hypothetical protein
MKFSYAMALRIVAPIVLLLMPAAAFAQKVEAPPTFNAAQISGIQRVGPNYTIENPVRSDGLLRVYLLKTPYGDTTVRGDAMLKMRLNELHALALLEKVSSSDTFAKALAQAGLNPLEYTGRLITNPLGTVKETLSGVGAMFGRIGAGISNAGKTPDDAVAGVLGVTTERRELAATYGVDPYTDFAPLAAKLAQLSQAAALGGLAVTGALLAVPGAAGIVVSNLSTANKLNDIGLDELARKYTAAQILDLNRSLLDKMGVAPDLRDRLLANTNYTPIDMAALVAALDSMADVQGREVFVARAAAADQRFIAYFTRRQAELLAAAHHRHGGFVRFVSLADHPFVLMRDGRMITLAPIDALSWTSTVAAGFDETTAARRHLSPKATGVILVTGRATTLAKRRLKAQGWAVLERQ